MGAAPRPTFHEADFRKARLSQPQGNCVRVARRGQWAVVRDDKTVFGSAADQWLVLTAEEFDAFQEHYRATGEVIGTRLEIVSRGDMFVFQSAAAGPEKVELVFDRDELAAFLDGVEKREFDAAAFALN